MNIYPFLGIEEQNNKKFISDTLANCNFKYENKLLGNILTLIEQTVKSKFLPVIELERKTAHAAELVESDDDFILGLSRSEEWKEYFFESYPELYPYLNLEYEKIRLLLQDILTRFDNDRAELAIDGSLVNIEIGEGDFHNGKCTCCLIFEDGFRLFYKPRTLEGDQRTIDFFLEQQSILNIDVFYPVENRTFDDYGWSFSVDLSECKTEEEVKNYYKGLGVLTAFSHALKIEDLIYDNVLCASGKVALIDLECIVSTSFILDKTPFFLAKTTAGIIYRNSVFKSGLIPRHTYGGKSNDGESDGALSFIPDRSISEKTFKTISDDGEELFIAPERHIPILNGRHQEPIDFLDFFREGFELGYNHVVENKEVFSQFLESLVGIETRIIWRPTKVYSTLLNESFHMDYLSKEGERSKLFELMHNGAVGGIPDEVIQSEIKQLTDNDIPAFRKVVGTNDILDFAGNSLGIPYYYSSDIEQSLERIEQMGEKDYQFQLEAINSSFKIFLDDEPGKVDLEFQTVNEELSTREMLQCFVGDITDHLQKQLFIEDDKVSLMDFSTNVNNGWRFGPIGPGLANGTDSIALLLLAQGVLNSDQKALETADHIFACNKNLFYSYLADPEFYKDHDYFVFSPLQFPGCLLYYAAISDELRPESNLLSDEELLTSLETYYFRWLEKDNYYDYLIGSCGAVVLFYQLFEKTGNDRFKKLAIHCAQKVASTAIDDGEKAYWTVEKFQGLGGFSHGTSSYALAMLMAHKLTNSAEYFGLFERALAYDRSFFDNEMNAYLDNRYYPNKVGSHAWAHGTGGIGLSRVLMKHILPDYPGLNEEIRICHHGLRETVDNSEKYSVNGGFAGVIELLQVFNNELDQTNDSLDEKWRDRILGWTKNPETLISEKNHLHLLMNQGLSGLGYAILRYLYSDRLPSYLYLGVETNKGPNSFYK